MHSQVLQRMLMPRQQPSAPCPPWMVRTNTTAETHGLRLPRSSHETPHARFTRYHQGQATSDAASRRVAAAYAPIHVTSSVCSSAPAQQSVLPDSTVMPAGGTARYTHTSPVIDIVDLRPGRPLEAVLQFRPLSDAHAHVRICPRAPTRTAQASDQACLQMSLWISRSLHT